MPAFTQIAPAAPQPAQDTSDNTDRYMGRVAQHLEGLPPAERLPFLKGQRRRWISLYERFCDRVECGWKPEFDENATDYLLTIAALDQRIGLEARKAAVIPTEANDVPDYAQDGFSPPPTD